MTIKIFGNGFSSRNVKLLIDILREEIENKDSEKIELEERYKSIMLACFGIVGLSKNRAKEQKEFFKGTPLNKLQFSNEPWREKNCSEKLEFED